MWYVYKIVERSTGRAYVGVTANPPRRKSTHFSSLRCGRHHNPKTQAAWMLSSKKDFQFIVVKECSYMQEAMRREHSLIRYMIKVGKAFNINTGYTGGDTITHATNYDERCTSISSGLIRKMSKMTSDERKQKYGKLGAANGMYGRHHTQAAKDRISEAHKGNTYAKGRVMSDEQRAKLSAAASARTGARNPFYGRKHTDAAKAKISKAMKGNTPSNVRKVFANGCTYLSVTDAARALGVSPALIVYRIVSTKPKYAEYEYLD